MSGSPEFVINEALYQRCVRGFSLLRRRLGINIAVHADDGVIDQGQIFLFNHFARFETIIPQYFIYQATGAYCRCLAHHELFEGNERFANFLTSCGAVPNNHPGLLAFLAAEILRGRKVIIFPEGSMIKDRRIGALPGSGLLPARDLSSGHRQGAAALAVILEIFKKRILSVFEAGDAARLDRWVAALGLPDQVALLAAASKPTLVVPANITFFPIHTGDNILRKAAEYLGLDLSEQTKEELLIEGNLLLRDTDMDIRFGQPFHPDVAWNLADRLLVGRIFERIDSLDELFGLKDTAGRWIERMAAITMRRGTRRLRDLCMVEMYARVTVNLGHLASSLLMRLLETGETEIERQRFHRLLYRIVKEVQALPGLHLHRTLIDPESYDGIHDGTGKLLGQFLETAAASSLIEIGASHYRLLPALRNGHAGNGGRDPRIENVIRVYANEIAALAAVTRIVEGAVPAGGDVLARFLFDDELRSYERRKQGYKKPRHAAINGHEVAAMNGEPFLMMPAKPLMPGVVLVHGFLASPAELRELGQGLVDRGHPVLGVRLKGHGTSPWDLHERSWEDWLASVRRGYEIMSNMTGQVLLAGFATGASLALHHASAKPEGLAGVVAVSAPIRFRARDMAYTPLIHQLNRLGEWVYAQDGFKPFQEGVPEHPGIEYRHMPVRGLVELRKAAEELERRLPQVSCPAAIIQATGDPIVDPESARLIHGLIGSAEKSLHMIQSERHGILHEDVAGTRDLVISLLGGFAGGLTVPVPLPTVRAPKIGAAVTRALTPWLKRLRRSEMPPPKQPYPWERSYPGAVDWRATIVPKSLPALFDEAVATHAARVCMSFRGRHYRYREVGRLVDRAAKGLRDLGVRRGIKVGLLLPNCPYAVICFHAVLKAGGTVVNINPLYSRSEIERQAVDADVRILVSLDIKALYEKASGLVEGRGVVEKILVCPMKGVLPFTEKLVYGLLRNGDTATIGEDDRHVFFDRLIDNDGVIPPVAIDPMTDIAVLQYTGGTTGFPKGAELTHANLHANATQLVLWAPGVERGQEKSLAVLPLFHSFGMTAVMNLSLLIGAEMVLLPRFGAAEVLNAIKKEKPTIFIGVPTMFSALASHRGVSKQDLSSLKFCISGGAPLPAPVREAFEALAPCKLLEGYGLSEASPVCTVNPLDGGKQGSAGLPLPATVIEIVALDDPEKHVGPSERGEICVTGPQVMAGYANRANENVEAFRGARLHTGDIGYLDADGYLFVVDRIKDLILSGGFNVYPRLVEEAIELHPAVAEAAVCGMPDAHRGEIVGAFVRLREGASVTAAELREFCGQHLAPFEIPRKIEFRDDLPRTFLGKISRRDLKTEVLSRKQAGPNPENIITKS